MKFHLTLQEANTLIDRAFNAGYIDEFIIHELTKRGIYESWLAETDSLEGFKLLIGENRYLYLDFVDDFVSELQDNLIQYVDRRITYANKCSQAKNKVKADIFELFKSIVTKNSPTELKDFKACIDALQIIQKYYMQLDYLESFNDVVNELNSLYKKLSMEE